MERSESAMGRFAMISRWFLVIGFATVGLQGGLSVAQATGDNQSETSHMATFDTATGETFFALGLLPPVDSSHVTNANVAVVFDTSASQTGLYREQALESLQTLLSALDPETRVQLLAGDLQAVALSEGFVAPAGEAMAEAIQKLQRRTPLGATDMKAILLDTAKALTVQQKGPRTIVYIGDGLSRSNILQTEEFRQLVKQLVEPRITVSSFAIGPERDLQLLATLANHTGGIVLEDTNQPQAAQQAGLVLAASLTQAVYWPISVTLPKAFQQSYPSSMPPLRKDRDSILIGRLADRQDIQLVLQAEAVGQQQVTMQWSIVPRPSLEDFSFLPQLVSQAKEDGGLTLPTAGSVALRMVASQIAAGAQNLVGLAEGALKTGDLEGARTTIEAVLRRDPSNPQALQAMKALEKLEQDRKDGLFLKGNQ